MCGICGIVTPEKSEGYETAVRRMAEAMAHRGPDDEGVYSAPGICLGHRRLSIIDLSSAARQPLSNEDKSVWVILNGEVYNYKELRARLERKGHVFSSNSDTEAIVHLYEEEGRDCVKSIVGMFAFGVWDVRERQLFLARDRVGKKPLLYSDVNGGVCFASEFAAFLKSGLIKKEINLEALDYYLSLGYIPAPLTIYKDVFKLKPAHTLTFKDGHIDISRYWQLDYGNKTDMDEAKAQDKIEALLTEAVRTRLYSDVPLGVFLSGGIDSSLVVGVMSKVYNQRIKTFSIGFDESDYNELRFARNIAGRFNTEHNEFIVRPKALEVLPGLVERYGEPYADPSCVPTYYLSRLSKEHVSVVLNGDGGDEVFAGYERYQAMLYTRALDGLPANLRKFVSSLFLNSIPESADGKSFARKTRRMFEATSFPLHKRYMKWVGVFDDELKEWVYSPQMKGSTAHFATGEFFEGFLCGQNGMDLLDRLLRLDTLTYLPDDLLVKVDIAAMANALEARSPFLDHRLMEFAASLPPRFKLRRFTKKYILKNVASRMIPPENIHREKQGFGVPIGRWFRSELKDFLCQNLLWEKSLKRGYFKPDAIKRMVELHLCRRRDYSFQLWALLMLELWHQKFMD